MVAFICSLGAYAGLWQYNCYFAATACEDSVAVCHILIRQAVAMYAWACPVVLLCGGYCCLDRAGCCCTGVYGIAIGHLNSCLLMLICLYDILQLDFWILSIGCVCMHQLAEATLDQSVLHVVLSLCLAST